MNFSTAFGKFPRAFFFFFRSKRSLVSVGYWKKKLQILLAKRRFLSSRYWKDKVSDSLDQTAVFVKGVLGNEKISDSFAQSGSS